MGKRKGEDEILLFENEWVDVSALTNKEWNNIKLIAQMLVDQDYFDRDKMKCLIGAFVIWVSEFHTPEDAYAPDGSLKH